MGLAFLQSVSKVMYCLLFACFQLNARIADSRGKLTEYVCLGLPRMCEENDNPLLTLSLTRLGIQVNVLSAHTSRSSGSLLGLSGDSTALMV